MTRFHDFAAMVVGWVAKDRVAQLAPLLIVPVPVPVPVPVVAVAVADADVADLLAELATAARLGASIELAGPLTEDLVDMVRRRLVVRGETVQLIPTWRGMFGAAMAGEVLLLGGRCATRDDDVR